MAQILENVLLRYKVVGGNNYVLSQTNPKPRLDSACGLTPSLRIPHSKCIKTRYCFQTYY